MADSRSSICDEDEELQREIAILKKIKHPNCVQLIEVLEVPDGDQVYMGTFTVCSLSGIVKFRSVSFSLPLICALTKLH
jgi:serine/threonine protein kinase